MNFINLYKSKAFILNIIVLYYLINIYLLFINKLNIIFYKKRIGVINIYNNNNVGNILVKFSMFKKLKELGFYPIIITKNWEGADISFLKRTVKLTILKKNFYELKNNKYDYLILNSDQTWSFFDKEYFYEYAFLKFAQNWTIPKIIYGASMGTDKWLFTIKDEEIGKYLLKNFTGISFREIGLVKLVKKHLNIKSKLVLDPTFIIDKKYYLDEIKYFKRDFIFNEKYLFVYQLDNNTLLEKLINEASKKLNYKIYKASLNDKYYIENFIFGMNISKAVLTDSYHGTVFSIIFNKPFISYVNINRGKGRFDSLIDTFNLYNRIKYPRNFKNANISLLLEPLEINQTLLNKLKISSINFLKKNLGLNSSANKN